MNVPTAAPVGLLALLTACAGDKSTSPSDTSDPSASVDLDGDGVYTPDDYDDADSGCWRPPADIEGEIRVTSEDDLAAVCDGMCPGVTLHGSLSVGAPELTDLSGLSCLSEVDRGLTVTGLTGLTSLRGLDNLVRVGETLNLESLPVLSSLEPLARLGELGVGLTLRDLPQITSLSPLAAVHALGLGNPFGDVGGLQVDNLDALPSLEGLSTLEGATSPTGGYLVSISDCAGLTSLEGLGWMRSGTLMLQEDPAISSLAGTGLVSLDLLSVAALSGLVDLSGLEGVEVSALSATSLPAIQSLDGPTFPSTMNALTVVEASQLEDLSGLEDLSTLSLDLELRDNTALSSLAGLGALREVGGNLTITGNPALPASDVDDLVSGVTVAGTTTVSDNGP